MNNWFLNDHGQPVIKAFNRARSTERDVSELLGLAKGVLADGHVSEIEAHVVRTWVESHAAIAETWPITCLAQRLDAIYSDGRVEEDERIELQDLLKALVGGNAGIIGTLDAATELPLDTPAPAIVWSGRVFVFTGQMAFGTRRDCQRHVQLFGGLCDDRITISTNYVVIGTFGSRDWLHSSFGRKIEQAVKYRDAGCPLAIVSEDHWADQLPAHRSRGTVV